MVFVKLDEEGSPIPISDRVKIRYQERFNKYGRGLLLPEEMEQEKIEKEKMS
jgi:co-chaperonin GroES (HSP10)